MKDIVDGVVMFLNKSEANIKEPFNMPINNGFLPS
jgi:hypothetical protein